MSAGMKVWLGHLGAIFVAGLLTALLAKMQAGGDIFSSDSMKLILAGGIGSIATLLRQFPTPPAEK